MRWYRRDPQAFITGTATFTLEERGAYSLLLDYQWDMVRLPVDDQDLAALLGVSVQRFRALWERKVGAKFKQDDRGYYNQRLEDERLRALEISRTNRRNARKRWDDDGNADDDASADATASDSQEIGSPTRARARRASPLSSSKSLASEGESEGGVVVPDALAPLSRLLDRARAACASTRKRGQMADSIWQGTLVKLADYPFEAVAAGVRTYLDREDHLEGKDERYLLGVVRGMAKDQALQRAKDARTVNDGILRHDEPPAAEDRPEIEVDPEAMARWGGAVEALLGRIDPQVFDTWFRPLSGAAGMDPDGTVVLVVPNEVFADWITGKYGDQIRSALGGEFRCEVGIPVPAREEAHA